MLNQRGEWGCKLLKTFALGDTPNPSNKQEKVLEEKRENKRTIEQPEIVLTSERRKKGKVAQSLMKSVLECTNKE